jgi:hypothetical protein
MNVTTITPPEFEPLTLTEAKTFMRAPMNVTSEDDLIADAIASARELIESETHRQLMTATLELGLDGFPGPIHYWHSVDIRLRHPLRFHREHAQSAIRLPRPPLQTVNSVKYIDMSGTQQTLDPSLYIVDERSKPGRILPAYGKCWPEYRNEPNAVIVQFVAGWTSDTLPSRVKSLMKLLTQHMYEHRDDKVELPITFNRLMGALKFGDYQ